MPDLAASKIKAPSAAAKSAAVERVTIPVTGMTCAACQSFVQRTLASEAGVRDASVNLMLHNATVTFDPRATSIEGLVEKIRSTGYGAEMPVASESAFAAQQKSDEDQLREYRLLRTKAWVSVLAGIVAMIVSMPLMSVAHSGMQQMPVARMPIARMNDPFMNWSVRVLDPVLRAVLPWLYQVSADSLRWFLFFLSAFIVSWAGRRFYVKAWSALRHKTADMNTLVALGTGAAFLYSAASTIAPGFFLAHGIAPDVYYEAGILIIGLVLVGNTLESRAKSRTARALRKLVELQPKNARVLRDGVERDLPLEEIQHG